MCYTIVIVFGAYQMVREEVEWQHSAHVNTPEDNKYEEGSYNAVPCIHKAGVNVATNRHAKRQPPPTAWYQPTSKAKVLESETWALQMGGCNKTQLKVSSQHVVGIPQDLEFHPFQFIDFKEQARVCQQPAGTNPL